jgi:signal transduction histidine kinase/ActR/RegA family two-component response regulator
MNARQSDTGHVSLAGRLDLLCDVTRILLRGTDAQDMIREVFAKLSGSLSRDTEIHFKRIDDSKGGRFWKALECSTAPIVATHVQASADPELVAIKSAGIRTFFSSPLLVGGTLLGTVAFASSRRDEFTDAEVALFRTIPELLGYALERVEQNDRLHEADRRKDDFLATLAHELRNPLAPIRNGLEILRVAGRDTEASESARDVLDRQVTQLVRLVDDLLDVSRISRGKLELRMQPACLAAVVRSAIEVSRPHIEERGHTLSVDLPSDDVRVRGDVARLTQVFSNLLNNAAKYTERGGAIWVRVEVASEEATVSVRDNGVGIPAPLLRRVFEMFTQADGSLERSQGGLGIGLGIVERLVALHGGAVEARSQGANAGSEFRVTLPLLRLDEERPVSSVPGEARQTAGSRARRVLVADDDADTVKSLALVLRLRGDIVRTARHGGEAVEVAQEFQPDVVLLDIAMPVLNGYDACRRIREQPWGEDVVLVALTGWSQDGDRRRAKEAGFDRHLVKPIEPDLLDRLLDDLAGGGGRVTRGRFPLEWWQRT